MYFLNILGANFPTQWARGINDFNDSENLTFKTKFSLRKQNKLERNIYRIAQKKQQKSYTLP